MRKFLSFIFSTRTTAFLFLLFGAAMGLATFIENDYNTQTAKALIYDSWWFKLIMVVFVINFFGNIRKYRLVQRKMYSTLLLHLAFILILLGAAITRYISYEAIMPIAEGEITSFMLSEKTYLSVSIRDDELEKTLEEPLLLAQNVDNNTGFIAVFTRLFDKIRGGNYFNILDNFKYTPFSITYLDYVPNAKMEFIKDEAGFPYFHLVESSRGFRTDHYLKFGERLRLDEADIYFGKDISGNISIYERNDTLFIKSHRQLSFLTMADELSGQVESETETPLKIRTLYTLGNLQFVIPEPLLHGKLTYSTADSDVYPEDMLAVKVNCNGEEKDITLMGAKYIETSPQIIRLGDLEFNLHYGAKRLSLPFAVGLNDFNLKRYPGSNSPKSFTSEVTIYDEHVSLDSKIFMNNVLDYKGFRFFQSSYDDSGFVEKTILSVNYDRFGTWTTYIGYILLFIGLILMMFSPKSYFGLQRKRLNKLKAQNTLVITLLLFCSIIDIQAQSNSENVFADLAPTSIPKPTLDALSYTKRISIDQAIKFGQIVMQDFEGRMKPMNTFSSEFLRKIYKKDHFEGFVADQIVLSIFLKPELWKDVPIIFMKKDNRKVRELLGISKEKQLAKLSDFFTSDGTYKLIKETTKAHKKKIKSEYEKSILNIDGRVSLMYLAIQMDLFTILPIKWETNNKWVSPKAVDEGTYLSPELVEIKEALDKYKSAQLNSKNTLEDKISNSFFEKLNAFQKNEGVAVMPTSKKIDLEILYNKYNIFKNLFWQYMLTSLFLFIAVITQVFKDNNRLLNSIVKIGVGAISLLFLVHTTGLAMRWYISGHAPWSNGYESMIYVAWATLFFGLILGRQSALTIASTTFVTSMILMVAHWNWLDPSINNLVPVLDSYWLMIHVAIIVAAYGPFAVGMILGMINLVLYAIKSKSNHVKIERVISELTIINGLALTIGLVMLTIGTFLGGIWANESWGRYWGWDPKETWALISIMTYAFVIHLRLVPKLSSKFLFNVFSIFAFSSILMTYMGVNHLLSGLHSYAAGESAPIPNEIWGWLAIATLLSVIAFFRKKQLGFYEK